jgi:hypothetical protein
MIRMIELKYILTGTGRCGTVFFSNVMTSLGLNCLHEGIFTPDGLEQTKKILSGEVDPANSLISERVSLLKAKSKIVADSSYMAAPYLCDLQDVKVIHLVRHPMKVVSSFIGWGFDYFKEKKPCDLEPKKNYEAFIYRFVPELACEMSQLDRACLFYVRWNQMIEQSGKVNFFQRIEDNLDDFKKYLGKEKIDHHKKIENIGIQQKRVLKIEQIRKDIRKEFIDMMLRYNYSPEKFY